MKKFLIAFTVIILHFSGISASRLCAQGGDLQITCEPGLRIYLDDTFVGKSNVEEDGKYLSNLSPGLHTIRIEKTGFTPRKFTVNIISGKAKELRVGKLVPGIKITDISKTDEGMIAQSVGSLIVQSAPISCDIHFVDNTYKKTTTEKRFDNVPIGSYFIRFSRRGKELSYTLEIEKGKVREIKVDFLKGKIIDITAEREQEIRAKYLELKRQDNLAYQFASSKNTISAYKEYLDKFPNGQHTSEARQKIKELEELNIKLEIEKRKNATRPLRSFYKELHSYEAIRMLKKYGFFAIGGHKIVNPNGNFRNILKNQYEKKIIDGNTVVIDHATELMWHPSGFGPFRYGRGPIPVEAVNWLHRLNEHGYAGYQDWRLPTLEEAASLLESEKRENGLFIDPIFSGTVKYIVTGDTITVSHLKPPLSHWAIKLSKAIIYYSMLGNEYYLKPVRSKK